MSRSDCAKCSHAASCCSQAVSITRKEAVRLKRLGATVHHIKGAHWMMNTAYTRCTFLDENNKCSIYAAWPTVCRNFECDGESDLVAKARKTRHARIQVTAAIDGTDLVGTEITLMRSVKTNSNFKWG